MDENTPKRTLSHKLAVVNKVITQQVPSEQSKKHLMYEYLKTPGGREVLDYYQQQESIKIGDDGVGM